MEPPSLTSELALSLSELSFGVKSSQVLTTGPIAGSVGAPPMANIEMSDGANIMVQVTEHGWQVCDPTTQVANPKRYETLDDLLNEGSPTYAALRQDALMQKLFALAAERGVAE